MHMTISPSGKVGTKKQATMSRKAQKAEKQRQQAAEKNKVAAKN